MTKINLLLYKESIFKPKEKETIQIYDKGRIELNKKTKDNYYYEFLMEFAV